MHRHHGLSLMAQGRCEQALSVLQKTLRLRKETMGERHFQTLDCMVSVRACICVYTERAARERMCMQQVCVCVCVYVYAASVCVCV